MTRRNFIQKFLISLSALLGIGTAAKKLEAKPQETSTPTTIKILVGDKVVGAIQSLNVKESRDIKYRYNESGQIIDSYPSGSTNINISASRVRFDKTRVAEAFSRGFVHVYSQKVSFQIEIYDGEITTKINNCWIKSIPYSYSVNDWYILDSMELEAESIASMIISNGIFKHTKK